MKPMCVRPASCTSPQLGDAAVGHALVGAQQRVGLRLARRRLPQRAHELVLRDHGNQADQLGHAAVGHALVGAQQHVGLRLAGGVLLERAHQVVARDDVVADVEAGRRRVMPSASAAPPSLFLAAATLGRSIFRLDVISGAAIMKITSSTSMTSISGVMLMSLIGCDVGLRSRRPKAMACCRQRAAASELHLAQVVREAFELGLAGGRRACRRRCRPARRGSPRPGRRR